VAQLYADENFPREVAVALRQLGHDVLTVQEAGNANQGIPDDEVLAFAIRVGRAVITLNRRDFIRLHRAQPEHAGIIVCTQDDDTLGQAQRIHDAMQDLEFLAGHLIRVNRPLR